MIRFFDIFFSLIGIVFLSPLFIIVYILICLESAGGGFYFQQRVGIHGTDFKLWKFRTMRVGADKGSLITIGGRDPRMTQIGFYIRKFKIDELPQLINVLKGDMSLVGPRPEVRRYVDLYTIDQQQILNVRPGITDYASIEYADENELLGKSTDPENTYISQIMPNKIKLNMKYIQNKTVGEYFKIIFLTLLKIVS